MHMRLFIPRLSSLMLAVVIIVSAATSAVAACPWCKPVKTTFSQDIKAADVAVLAEMLDRPEVPSDASKTPGIDLLEAYRTKFQITKIYRGAKHFKVGQQLEIIYTGDAPAGSICLIRGVNPPTYDWMPPQPISARVQGYLETVMKLKSDDPKWLNFFEDYLNDSEEDIRNDAFDEWARASYASMRAVGPDIDHDRLIKWIKQPGVLPMYRNLYFSMLSVCGKDEDIPMMEAYLTSGDRQQLTGLSSMIFCYLTLKGEAGMPLIEDTFLRPGWIWDPEYVHTYGAIMSIRMLGQDKKGPVSRDRLLVGLRIMLERPDLADLVIPDLARWGDWSAMDRLVALFKAADKKSSWVRVPIVNYLRACPLPEAKEQLAALSKIDPDAIRRASTFYPFAPKSEAKTDVAGDSDGKKKSDDKTDKKPAATSGASVEPPPTDENDTLVAQATYTSTVSRAEHDASHVFQAPEVVKPDKAKPAETKKTTAALPSTQDATNSQSKEPPAIGWFIGIPIGVALLLFAFMWIILRRPFEPTTMRNA
jgi:hypothetical protein